MSQIIDWDRLARYVAREGSAAERAEVERWLAEDPTRQALLRELELRWSVDANPAPVDVDSAWARVSSRLRDRSHTISEDIVLGDENGEARTFTVRRFALPIAAGLLLAIGLTYWSFTRNAGSRAGTLAAGTEYAVPRGGAQRAVTLGDSTEVILASASRLVVAAGYGSDSRTVDLEGEALFRVRHDEARPFRVRAGSVIAEDLGTEFVVRHLLTTDRGGGPVRIAVREGTVAVRSGDAPAARDTLRARDVAIANDTGVLVRRDQNLDAYFAWTRGQLVFDGARLSDVAAELSRWFDLDVEVADSTIANRTLNVTLLTTTPIEEILQIIGSSTDVKVERRGRVVRFTGPGYTGELPVRS
ncbi:MAG: FecR family protein, partial [Gemmatimonadaceae bacterium]